MAAWSIDDEHERDHLIGDVLRALLSLASETTGDELIRVPYGRISRVLLHSSGAGGEIDGDFPRFPSCPTSKGAAFRATTIPSLVFVFTSAAQAVGNR